jgi:hypothetical protein
MRLENCNVTTRALKYVKTQYISEEKQGRRLNYFFFLLHVVCDKWVWEMGGRWSVCHWDSAQEFWTLGGKEIVEL